MFFDPRAGKALQPGQHLLVQGCDGLRLVASATRRSWTYRYKAADGRMKQVSLGQWPEVPVQEAVARWQALREQRHAGADPSAQRRAARVQAKANAAQLDGTVQGVVQAYVQVLHAHRQPAGALAAERSMLAFLVRHAALAAQPAKALTRAQAYDAIDAIKATPNAAARLRSLLGAAWDHAIDAGRVPDDTPNWWRLVHKGRLKSKGKIIGGQHVGQRRRVLSGAELATLLAWLPNLSANARDVVVLYLWTGLRGAEIFGLRPEHVRQEADGWWWTIPKALTKNAAHPHATDLRIPLVGRALEVVQRRVAGAETTGGVVWVNERGRPYTQRAFGTYIYHLQPYSEKAKARQGDGLVIPVVDWTPHHLRKTARTLLADLGCPREVAEAIMGHMPPVIEATYNAYSYDRERRLWLTRLADRLGQVAG